MADQWYVALGNKKIGPFSFEELKERARAGTLLPIDMLWQEGTQRWRSASEVDGLCWPSAKAPGEAGSLPASPHNAIPPLAVPINPGDIIGGKPLPTTPAAR